MTASLLSRSRKCNRHIGRLGHLPPRRILSSRPATAPPTRTPAPAPASFTNQHFTSASISLTTLESMLAMIASRHSAREAKIAIQGRQRRNSTHIHYIRCCLSNSPGSGSATTDDKHGLAYDADEELCLWPLWNCRQRLRWGRR